MLFFLAFHFSISLTPNCRNWSPNYSVLVFVALRSHGFIRSMQKHKRQILQQSLEVEGRFSIGIRTRCAMKLVSFKIAAGDAGAAGDAAVEGVSLIWMAPFIGSIDAVSVSEA
jgi:hypothetical protein